MLEYMCTKPCAGPIISHRNKCVTVFWFYPSSGTENYQFMRLKYLKWDKHIAVSVLGGPHIRYFWLDSAGVHKMSWTIYEYNWHECLKRHQQWFSSFSSLHVYINISFPNSNLPYQPICDQMFPDTYLYYIFTYI